MTDHPTSTVTSITARPDGVWQIDARCPAGYPVHHGGGPTHRGPELGHRVSHCRPAPARGRLPARPACDHGPYVLTASPELLVDLPRRGR